MNLETVVRDWAISKMDLMRLTVEIIPSEKEWDLQIVEIIYDDTEIENALITSKFNKAISWTRDSLSNSSHCYRINHDTWRFSNKVEAEKFKTMFSLKWAA